MGLNEGAIRSEELWLREKRLVSFIIHRCVTCRKMRGKPINQKMADLPKDQFAKSPLFVDVDVFGPWTLITRSTKGEALIRNAMLYYLPVFTADRATSRSMRKRSLPHSLTP